MERPHPATRPAARRLVAECPPAMWPEVRGFLKVYDAAPPLERFKAALELVRDAETDEAWRAWMLVADYLEDLHHVDE